MLQFLHLETEGNNLLGRSRIKSDVYKAFISVAGIVSAQGLSLVYATNSASSVPSVKTKGQRGIAAHSNPQGSG